MGLELTPFTFVILALATGQIVDTWLHGSLFEEWRAETDLWDNRLGELLSCPMCLSHHVPYLAMLSLAGLTWCGEIPGVIGCGIIVSLAVTRTVLIIDGLLPARMRHDRDSVELGPPLGDLDDGPETGTATAADEDRRSAAVDDEADEGPGLRDDSGAAIDGADCGLGLSDSGRPSDEHHYDAGGETTASG